MAFILGSPEEKSIIALIPDIAKICHEFGLLSIAILSRTSENENSKQGAINNRDILNIIENVDSTIFINNEKAEGDEGLILSGDATDSDLVQLKTRIDVIQGIMCTHGVVSIDFQDVSSVLKKAGLTTFLSVTGFGEDRAITGSKALCNSLTKEIRDGTAITKTLLYIEYEQNDEVTISEIVIIVESIAEWFGSHTDLIWNVGLNNQLNTGWIRTNVIMQNRKSDIKFSRL